MHSAIVPVVGVGIGWDYRCTSTWLPNASMNLIVDSMRSIIMVVVSLVSVRARP